jgi:translation initiation factor IF-1
MTWFRRKFGLKRMFIFKRMVRFRLSNRLIRMYWIRGRIRFRRLFIFKEDKVQEKNLV